MSDTAVLRPRGPRAARRPRPSRRSRSLARIVQAMVFLGACAAALGVALHTVKGNQERERVARERAHELETLYRSLEKEAQTTLPDPARILAAAEAVREQARGTRYEGAVFELEEFAHRLKATQATRNVRMELLALNSDPQRIKERPEEALAGLLKLESEVSAADDSAFRKRLDSALASARLAAAEGRLRALENRTGVSNPERIDALLEIVDLCAQAGAAGRDLRMAVCARIEALKASNVMSSTESTGDRRSHTNLVERHRWEIPAGLTVETDGASMVVVAPADERRLLRLLTAATQDWADFVLRMRFRFERPGSLTFLARATQDRHPVGFTLATDGAQGFEIGVVYDIVIELKEGRLSVGGPGATPETSLLPETVPPAGRLGFELEPGTAVVFHSITVDRV